jgi:hypothetical protein
MGGSYAEMREAWLEADRLGFDTAWGHDHLLNQNDIALPEDEGWTVLTALLAQSQRIRGGLMVTANTFRHRRSCQDRDDGRSDLERAGRGRPRRRLVRGGAPPVRPVPAAARRAE